MQNRSSLRMHTHDNSKKSKPIQNPRNIPKGSRVIAIGTSLVKELHLRTAGLNGLTYCYPGQQVPYITSRIEHILKDDYPDFVYLQCAGNDLESYPNSWVIQEYELLIKTVRSLSPQSTIILGAVPLRGTDNELHTRIHMFNTYLLNRGKQADNVVYLNAAPIDLKHYKKDMVHFNSVGASIFENNIVKKIKYLDSFPLPQVNRRT